MAEYGIVMTIKDINGNIAVDGHANAIGCLDVQFGSAATRTSSGGGNASGGTTDRTSVNISSVSVGIHAGKWTAEIMQACYMLKKIGDVVIQQLAQAVDKASSAKATTVQKITLTNARIISVGQIFQGGDRSANVVFEFDKILYEIGTKPADFTVRNTTAGAT